MSFGFVYVLGNPAFPGIYKIGFTERSPSLRCKELSASTAAPSPFVLCAYYELEDARTVERDLHFILDEYRINESREFFQVSLYTIAENLRCLDTLSHYESYLVDASGVGREPFTYRPAQNVQALTLRD